MLVVFFVWHNWPSIKFYYPCFTDEGTELTEVNLISPKVLERRGDSNYLKYGEFSFKIGKVFYCPQQHKFPCSKSFGGIRKRFFCEWAIQDYPTSAYWMLIIYFILRNGTVGTQSFYFTSMVGMEINLRIWGSPHLHPINLPHTWSKENSTLKPLTRERWVMSLRFLGGDRPLCPLCSQWRITVVPWFPVLQ